MAAEFLTDERISEMAMKVLDDPGTFKVGDARAFYSLLKDRTAFSSIKFDCCPRSCVSYAAFPNEDKCPKCGDPRWHDMEKKKDPIKTHVYFPVRHRLLLWFTSKFMSRLLVAYRRKAVMLSLTKTTDGKYRNAQKKQQSSSARKLTDVWSGQLYKALRSKGFFSDQRELGFCCGFDGTKAFKTRKNRYVWPIILTCINLPPEIRFKRKNVLIVGLIPGPDNPKDVDSFLTPLVGEFEMLSGPGIPNAWDAASNSRFRTGKDSKFTLRAHIVLVTTDMPARTKILHMMGMHSISYCEYCQIRGLSYGGMHCPHKPPTNFPDELKETQRQKQEEGRPFYNWKKDYTSANSILREDVKFREIANYVSAHRADNPTFAESTGIAGKSIFMRLSSLFFPASFPPCTMHLFYENVVQTVFDHYAGRYFVARPNQPSSSAASKNGPGDDQVAEDGNAVGGKGKSTKNSAQARKPVARAGPAFVRRKPGGNDPSFYMVKSDSYNIPPNAWAEIGKDTLRSNKTYPDQLGEEMTNLATSFRKMKAANWQRFLFHQSPVYFRKYLPREHYNEWMNMVEAMRLSTRKVLDEHEVAEVGQPYTYI